MRKVIARHETASLDKMCIRDSGWSFHEIVYKRRMGNTKNPTTKSKYTDGLIGWKKLPIRAQETLYRWEYDLSLIHICIDTCDETRVGEFIGMVGAVLFIVLAPIMFIAGIVALIVFGI